MPDKQPEPFPAVYPHAVYPAKRDGKVDRTNEPGTCLYCGAKLKPFAVKTDPPRFGQYGDNAFCSLSCAARFGVWMAHNGERLQPRKDQPKGKK